MTIIACNHEKDMLRRGGRSMLGISLSRLFLFLFLPAISSSLNAQEYTFSEIQEILFTERARTGDPALRDSCFASLDDLIMGTYPPLHPETESFYTLMIRKAVEEIKTEHVTGGATVWLIYNHGFVVKTPSTVFGFDLHDYFTDNQSSAFLGLADLLDVTFVSHWHGDHRSDELQRRMIDLGKPVVSLNDVEVKNYLMAPGDSAMIGTLRVIAHDGLHSLPVLQFEVVTPEGLKFLHTGDNQTPETLPDVQDVDVMMVNCWIALTGGAHVGIEGVRMAIDKVKPLVSG
ncbi:hypothetical protein JXO52_07435 [bacterium]|nr:hypothetical protein [bacterium]